MRKFIAMLLCAFVFGLFCTNLEASVPKKDFKLATEQSYCASDQGVPVQVTIVNHYANIETVAIEKPYFLHPRIHDGANLHGQFIMENLNYNYSLRAPICRICNTTYTSNNRQDNWNPGYAFRDLPHNFG